MRHGSLFSGMGGFDLAAEWMGWENVFHCEWNKFNQKILKHYWPDAKSYDDITKTDFSIHRGTIDIITGGFPCQPYSQAGKRKGKEDERHLWPEMLRAIREVQPSWVVGENVPGLLNWNRGMVLHEIKTDLESEGFEVFPPCVLPACAVNAPHKRDRVWFIAYSVSNGFGEFGSEKTGSKKKETKRKKHRQEWDEKNGEWNGSDTWRAFEKRDVANTKEQRFQKRDGEQIQHGTHTTVERYGSISQWQNFPTVSPIHDRNDGISYGLDTETISKSKWRNESIKAGGNAIVPQVAYEIFKAIEATEKMLSKEQSVQVSDTTKSNSNSDDDQINNLCGYSLQ